MQICFFRSCLFEHRPEINQAQEAQTMLAETSQGGARLSTPSQERPLDLSAQPFLTSLLHLIPHNTRLNSLLSLLNASERTRVRGVLAITSNPSSPQNHPNYSTSW